MIYKQTETDNLCNYLILPLCNLSRVPFINESNPDNFINSFVDVTNFQVVVQMKSKENSNRDYDDNHYYPNFSHDTYDIEQDCWFAIFNIPENFHEDVLHFYAGRYSKISKEAFEKIVKYSGLNFNKPLHGSYITHPILLAIVHTDVLKNRIEQTLKIEIDANAEWMDKPLINNFIF